ncbi:MAG: hypothetical protein M3P06_11620 [Acidobacteriota bacterium]|nr:hypothetical protein [Acidobacteriota bacterium]
MMELALGLLAIFVPVLIAMAVINARLWKIRTEMDKEMIAWMKAQEEINAAFLGLRNGK